MFVKQSLKLRRAVGAVCYDVRLGCLIQLNITSLGDVALENWVFFYKHVVPNGTGSWQVQNVDFPQNKKYFLTKTHLQKVEPDSLTRLAYPAIGTS